MEPERAHLAGARAGAGLAALEAEVHRLLGCFAHAGAERVDPAALQPADVLLDLYGENIRARAFVTSDGRSEWMLRPDFTVPVVRRHMAAGAVPARYAYAGPVWRRPQAGAARMQEHLQCGFELFGGADPAAADAEVFALFAQAVAGRGLEVAIGDMGLLRAAIGGLSTSPARRAALARHLWRPRRFQELLERFSQQTAPPPVVDRAAIAAAGPVVGRRRAEDVEARLRHLAAEAHTPPIPAREVAAIHRILGLRAAAPAALTQLEALAQQWPALATAVARLADRLAALGERGVAVDDLPFEGAYGRTSMEYYDGFVFGFYAPSRPDLPVIASGGRYDALTEVLGGPAGGVPAVGGIIRPEALLALGAGA